VTDSVADVFSATLLKTRLLVLRLKVGALALSAREKLLETVPAVAVRVAVCAVVTELMVAEKVTLVALAGTVTAAGRVTAASLLERLTLCPPLPAAVLRVTVQASVPAPVIEALVQESAFNVAGAAAPVPLRLIVPDDLGVELLARMIAPVAFAVVEGSKLTFSVAVSPLVRVSGKLNPDILNPAPVSVPPLMMSGAGPVEVRMTDSVADVFSATLLKTRLLVLRLKVAMLALSAREKLLETVPAVAVRVAVCAVVTEAASTEKATPVELAGTVTVAGRVTAASLLERLMLCPPLPAAVLRVTLQASVPAPVIEALVQVSAFNVAGAVVPVPLRLITADGLAVELLARVSAPVTAPAAEGSKLTVSVAV
jgi:hypothetical protein